MNMDDWEPLERHDAGTDRDWSDNDLGLILIAVMLIASIVLGYGVYNEQHVPARVQQLNNPAQQVPTR